MPDDRPISRFSRTVRFGKIWRSSGTYPTPRRAIRWTFAPAISFPWNRTLPERGGVRPMMDRNVVVFPAPLRPIRHTVSPCATSRETPKRTWLVP